MPLTENFSVSQSAGLPENLTFTDISTGSDPAVTQRRIYLLQSDGTYLVPTGTSTDYIEWPLATNPITVENLLSQDTALSITVQWLDVSNTVLYTKTAAYGFQAFGENFYYGLVLQQVPITVPAIQQSTNYWENLSMFRCLLDSAYNAITLNSDVYAAQTCYDADQNIISNQQFYF